MNIDVDDGVVRILAAQRARCGHDRCESLEAIVDLYFRVEQARREFYTTNAGRRFLKATAKWGAK